MTARTPLPITAAILAGGRSSRMGVDKALLDVNGRTLLARAVEAVRHVCAETIVVASEPGDLVDTHLPSGVRIVNDDVPGLGPLGGLATAMQAAAHEWVLAVAVDMPFVEPRVVELLWSRRDDADAVLPVTTTGAEPLLALYATGPCLDAARAALDAGERRPLAVLDTVRTSRVDEDALRTVDPELRSLENVNTPDDLARVRGLPLERPITIEMNGTQIGTIMASPRDLDELAVGFLVTEGILTDRAALLSVDADEADGVVRIDSAEAVPDETFFRDRAFTSGCGKGFTFATVGHARGLKPIDSTLTVDVATLVALMREMAAGSLEYRRTGGMHACGLARIEANGTDLRCVREDVGRHNALDKVLGRAWLDGDDTADAVVLSTGRISYEMSLKAAKAGVPVVASRSTATDLAADVADTLGIALVGYVRGGRATVLTHPERITDDTHPDGDEE